MPKTKQIKTPKSREAIEKLLSLIAPEHPESVISMKLGVSAFAVRNWVARGIPKRHWQAFADLAGISLKRVQDAHIIRDR